MRAALSSLYEQEAGQLLRVAFAILRDAHEAEEVVHDAFAAMSPRLGAIDNPAAYLRVSVINGARRVLRRRVVRRRTCIPRDAGVELPERLAEFGDLLGALTDRRRTVVVLRYVCDLPDADIAATLGCTEGSVRSLARRALMQLRKELE